MTQTHDHPLAAITKSAEDIHQWSRNVITELEELHKDLCAHGDERCAFDMFGTIPALQAAQDMMRHEIEENSKLGIDAWFLVSTVSPEAMANKIFVSAWWENRAAEKSREQGEKVPEAPLAKFSVMVSGTKDPDEGRDFALSRLRGNAKVRGLELDESTVRRDAIPGIAGAYIWRARAKPGPPRPRRRTRTRKSSDHR